MTADDFNDDIRSGIAVVNEGASSIGILLGTDVNFLSESIYLSISRIERSEQ